MIPPITREEKYMYEIVGAGKTAPEKPLTIKEVFYAAILGEDRTVPRPITKEEKYLAALAGAYSEALPPPTTRIEKFLAKAAGMDVKTPVPVTREEIFWDNYSAVQKIEGIPPIVFTSNSKALKNYRIYGNTVDGESVGDLVAEGKHTGEYRVPVTVMGKNILNEAAVVDATIETDYTNAQLYHHDGKLYLNGSTTTSQSDFEIALLTTVNAEALEYINKNSGRYYFSSACPGNIQIRYTIEGSSTRRYSSGNYYTSDPSRTADRIVFRLKKDHQYNHEQMDIQIERGSGSTSYEPYHKPITTNLYLSEPLRMARDEAEYVDFENQKQYFVDGSYADVTLPELPTISGTNILSVNTQVKPSKVYVEGKIKTV